MSQEQNPQNPETANAAEPEVVRSICRNCGAMPTGQFCAECGQKEVNLNPTMLDFVHEVWHELLHVDGKLIPSMHLLLTSPGALTLEHYAGRRARYISPMRLYLVFSILFFALAAITPDTDIHVTVGASKSSGWTFEPRPVEQHSDPVELRKLGFESQEELQHTISNAVKVWMPRLMFLLVPLFAALISLVERNLVWNYPRHMHFALHLHAAWFLLLIISRVARLITFQMFDPVISTTAAVAIVVYFILALRRTYSLTLGGAIWRAMAVGGSYGVLFILALIVIVFPIVTGKG